MRQIASLFLLQRLKGSMSGDTCDFNMETRAVTKFFFFPARQGAKGNSRHGNMHHRMPLSKTGWPSLNVVIFPPVMRHVLETQNSDHPADYCSNSRANLGRPPDIS